MDTWASWVTVMAATELQQLRLLMMRVSESIAALRKGGGDIRGGDIPGSHRQRPTELQQLRLLPCH
jgi:hypothetical protein